MSNRHLSRGEYAKLAGVGGASVLYLSYVREEMDAGPPIKFTGFACLAMALLWPMRPWPT